MTTSHICIMIAIIVYLGAMIYVGYLCSKKIMTHPIFIWVDVNLDHWLRQ